MNFVRNAILLMIAFVPHLLGTAQDCENTGWIEFTTASWGAEISWSLTDEAGVTVAEGNNYSNYTTSFAEVCLGSGCHLLSMVDSFGDGWNGAYWTLTAADGQVFGPYTLTTGSLNFLDVAIEGDCGSTTSGCTDPAAMNYNPAAIEDDGSCWYDTDCAGCEWNVFDPVCAYDPASGAILSYPSYCLAVCEGALFIGEVDCETFAGCTDPAALNYNPYATVDDGSCVDACDEGTTLASMYLCTFSNGDEVALDIVSASGDTVYSQSGFGNLAIVYEDLCLGSGCYTATLSNNAGNTGWYNGYFSISGAGVYNVSLSSAQTSATFDFSMDGSCSSVMGCTNAESPNFNPLATWDDGSCLPPCNCEDEAYAPVCAWDWTTGEYVTLNNACEATCLGWSITWEGDCSEVPVYGCMDAEALNYNDAATVDQGCLYAPECGEGQIPIAIEMTAGTATPYWQSWFSVSDPYNPGYIYVVTYTDSASTYGAGCLYPGCYNFWTYEGTGMSDILITAVAGSDTTNFVLEAGDYQTTFAWGVGTDEPCEVQYGGCTDPEAENYNPAATFDNGSCTYPLVCDEGIVATLYVCTFSQGQNVGLSITGADGTVVYDQQGYSDMAIMYTEICIDPEMCYTVTMSNLAGDYGWYGGYYWVDAYGIQIDGGELPYWQTEATGTFGWLGACEGSSVAFGCTDPSASNYDPTATVDDGSCAYPSPCPVGQEVNFILLAMTEASVELSTADGEVMMVDSIAGNDWSATLCMEAGCYTFRLESANGESLMGSFAMMTLEDGTTSNMIAGDSGLMEADFGIGSECGNGFDGYGGSPWEFDETIAFTPYPNPTENVVNLTGSGWDEQFPIDVTIRDVAGKVVQRKQIQAGEAPQLNLSQQTAGLYLVEVRQGDRFGQAPVMKVR